MNSFGFIITRHVNSEKSNKYWNRCVKLLRTFYPHRQIVIIDDNSNYAFVKSDADYRNLTIIQSEFHGRGELLPYYYYIKNKFFENAVIMHDSLFLHKRVPFEAFNGRSVLPLWFFNPDKEDINNSIRITEGLRNAQPVQESLKLTELTVFGLNHNKWSGCFGCQAYINHGFLLQIENKYRITSMLETIKIRRDRCCLERILGCIFSKENPGLVNKKGAFGNIMDVYQSYEYTFDHYMTDLKKGTLPAYVIKVWTGR